MGCLSLLLGLPSSLPSFTQIYPKSQCRLGTNLLESSSAVKDLRVLVDNKLTMCQYCVLAAKEASCIPDCIRMRISSKLREVVFPSREVVFPLYSFLVRKTCSLESSFVLPTAWKGLSRACIAIVICFKASSTLPTGNKTYFFFQF